MYAMGHGLPRDYLQAVKWLSQAANQGNAQAENDLGVLYELGRGVKADPKTASSWFRKAAEKGVGAAQLSLAMLYQEGRGVPQDPVEAFAWANAATQYGEAHAQKLLDTVAKGLTPEQLHLAQKRAAEYERKYVAPFRTY